MHLMKRRKQIRYAFIVHQNMRLAVWRECIRMATQHMGFGSFLPLPRWIDPRIFIPLQPLGPPTASIGFLSSTYPSTTEA